jgi:hypothetical protein
VHRDRPPGVGATESFDAQSLEGIPVVVADEVGEYCSQFGPSTDPGEVLSVIAPPFDRFFVECQGCPPSLDLHAWGALIETAIEGDEDAEIRWHLLVTLVIEPRKGEPVGPVVRWILGVTPEGRWLRLDDGELVSGGMPPPFAPAMPEDVSQDVLRRTLPLLLPTLMTVSFMHCRNVTAYSVTPPEPLSRQWRKRRGRPLVRYEVLDIAPMRRVLDKQGQAQTRGLGHAFHICRGHFKTFTEDAPLFGRVTGQFWWADHVRGSPQHGEVIKDYRVKLDQPRLGRPYERADEQVVEAPRARTIFDPDAAGRGRQAHSRTQNALASAVAEAGLAPRRPKSEEPNYDLAWEQDGAIVVAEVKSLTPENEERQLRIAIGQVVRYRHQLARDGQPVRALIACERQPSDLSWPELCAQYGITLCWPETFREVLEPHT